MEGSVIRKRQCKEGELAMSRKKAVIAIEFDDSEDHIADCGDLATVAEAVFRRAGFKGLDVTVYATPEALVKDSEEGYGIFADGNGSEELPVVEERSRPAV